MSEPTPVDLNSKSMEELEALLEAGITGTPLPAVEPPPPVEQPPEQPPATEAAEKPPETEAQAAPPAVEAEAEKAEPENLDLEILKAALEVERAERKRWESLAGRHSGELGYIKRELQALKGSGRPPATDGETDDIERELASERERPSQPAAPTDFDSVVTYTVASAIHGAREKFLADHTDVDAQALREAVGKLQNYDASPLLTSRDPIWAAQETTRIFTEVYSGLAADAKAKRLTELETRKADQMRGAAEARQKATLSASGASPAPRQQAKTLDQMSLEELDQLLRESAG